MAARAVRENENGDESAAPDHSAGPGPGPDASAHAQALLQGNYGIIRSQDKRKGTTSWLVRLRRDGRRVGARYFYHHHYDSPEAALAAARAYRNALLELYPPLTSREHRQRLSKHKVSRVLSQGHRWAGVLDHVHEVGRWRSPIQALFTSTRMARMGPGSWQFGSASASCSMWST